MASTTPHGRRPADHFTVVVSGSNRHSTDALAAVRAVSKPAKRPVAAPVAALVIAQPNDCDS
jgi:hypothetical protein